MKDQSEFGEKYDYERRMEELGLAEIKKSRKLRLAFAIVLLLLGVMFIFATWVMSIVCWVGAIALLVSFFKLGAKRKDMVYVRKVGFRKAGKKGSSAVPSSAPSRTGPDVPSRSDPEALSAAAATLPNSYRAATSDDLTPPSEDGKDPDVYGPIKGF